MPPEEVQGVLGRAFSDFARDIDTAKTHLSRLAEGSVIVGAVRGMRPEDQAALATSMVPGVGDAAGLYADYTDIRENWDQVPWYDKAGMVGAAALGAVPFVPSRSQVNAGAEVARGMMTPSRTGETVEVFSGSYAPHPSEIEPYDERGPFNIFGGVFGSTRKEVAESHGDFIKKYDVDTGMMLEQRDLDNDEISVQLAKRLGISQDEASDVLTSYKRDEFSNDDAARLLGMSDSGEASWEMQAKIGDAARKAGYDAVELPDEHGTSILVLNDRLPQAGRLETPEVPREKTIAYHGSPTLENIDDFSLGAPKRTDEGFLGDAMYVSPQEYIAKGYAGESGLVHAVDMPEGKYKDFLYDENYRDTIENFAREIGVTEKPKTPEWAKSFSKKMKDSGYVGARGMNTDGTFAEAAIFQKEKITGRR